MFSYSIKRIPGAFTTCIDLFLSKRGQLSSRLLNGYATNVQKGDFVTTEINPDNGIAYLCLNRPHVNAMNFDMIKSITKSIDDVEKDDKVRGILWSSSSKKTFCAGLDLLDVIDPTPKFMREFWYNFQEMGMRLYGCRLPMVCAINGHMIAGGFAFTLSADYNVATGGNYKFGLNETTFGLYPPNWLMAMFCEAVVKRKAEEYLKVGRLLSLEECVKFGIVQEVVDEDKLMETAEKRLLQLMKTPMYNFGLVKHRLRTPIIQQLLDRREEEILSKIKLFTNPIVIDLLKGYVKKIQEKQ